MTICTHAREPILASRRIQVVTQKTWHWLGGRFPQIELDEFIIMPDHLHFVISLREDDRVGGGHAAVQGDQMVAATLGNVVGTFKTVAARSINAQRGTRGARVWQRNYFERVIRDDDELERVRDYIRNNPLMAHGDPSEDHAAAWRSRS